MPLQWVVARRIQMMSSSDPPSTPPPPTRDDQFIESMDRELVGWSDPVERLQQALVKNELELYCQPILSLTGSERFPIAELLVRLREEEVALLPPGEFLPVFEHYGMMPQLDRWVVRSALQRLARGSKIGNLSVNISAQAIVDHEFPAFVADQLGSTGVQASALIFEIDEVDVLTGFDAVARFGAAVRDTGCRLLIDGFGRRSVSFAPLKALHVAFVKVDGVIVRKLASSEIARSKMNAVVRVGEAIGIEVIGECVEGQDVLARLKGMGAGYAQGFSVYKPHPLDAVVEP